MWVEVKKRRNRDESLFVFEFSSKEDFEKSINALKNCCQYKPYLDIIDKIEYRCDDKYANEEVAMSSSLFVNEIADLVTYFTLIFESMTNEKK